MSSVVDGAGGAGVTGGQDPPGHGGQVGGEEDLGPDGLLDLGRVPVGEEAVGGEVLVHRGEVHGRRRVPSGARGPGGGVDDDPAAGDEAGPDQGGQGQGGGRRVTARRGHQGGPVQGRAEELGEAVGEAAEETGRLVFRSVPEVVGGRIGQAEVGGQVDEESDPSDQGRGQALGLPVGQGQEDDVEAVEVVGHQLRERQRGVGAGQRRIERSHRLTGLAVGPGHHHLEFGMAGAEAEEFRTGVARRPVDPDLHGATLYINLHTHAMRAGLLSER